MPSRFLRNLLATGLLAGIPTLGYGATRTWTSPGGGAWANDANWDASPFPGSDISPGVTNPDTAVFLNAGSLTVTLPSYLNIQNVTFAGTNYVELQQGLLSFTSGGTLQHNGSYVNIFSAMQVNGAGLTVNATQGLGLIGNIGGDGGITYNSTSSLQIDGISSYQGATTFNSGSAMIKKMSDGGQNSSVGASSSDAANLVFSTASQFRYTGTGDSTDRSFTVKSGGNFEMHFVGSGALKFTSTAAIAFANSNTNVKFVLLGQNAGDNTLALAINDNGTGVVGIDKYDIAKVILSGNNSYTGHTGINGGIVNIRHDNALGSTVGGSSFSNSTLQIEGNINVGAEALLISGNGFSGQNGVVVNVSGNNTYGGLITLGAASRISSDAGSLQFTNTGTITGAGFGLTLTGAGDGAIASVIGTGAGTLTKNGTGTWRLSGANAHSGDTSVNAGTLLLNNAGGSGTGSGSVVVAAGATVGGNGIIKPGIGKSLTVNGVVAPGDPVQAGGIGTLIIDAADTAGAVANFGSTATFAFNLDATLVLSDSLRLLNGSAGDLVFNLNTINFTVSGALSDGQTFLLFDGTDSNQYAGLVVDGSNQIVSGLSFAGLAPEFQTNSYLTLVDGDIYLNVAAVPEPATLGCLAVGGIILALRRRRL